MNAPMLPYLTLPIALPGLPPEYDKDGNLVSEGNPDKTVDCDLYPSQVIAYHEGYAFGTMLYLTTGQAFMCMLTVAEYRKAVTFYWQEAQKLGKKSNIIKMS
jgi:hypothetical protein